MGGAVRARGGMAVEERDIEVAKEDQQRINVFSRLNLRYDDLDEEIKSLKKSVQQYKDATEEIEGCMESDGIMLKVGEAYTLVEEDTAGRLSAKTDEIEEVKTEMDKLKKLLYSKFG